MNAESIKQVGLIAIFGGILALALSTSGAYVFPYTNVPPNTDLATLLTIGWQRLVLTLALVIVGVLGVIAGTMLYGFGRLIEELTYLQPLEETPQK
jgi:hypothetical protein